MIMYEANFKKSDGTKRKMRFVRLNDLPAAANIINKPMPKRVLASGSELVWDMDKNNYRVFNWKSVIGNVKAKLL